MQKVPHFYIGGLDCSLCPRVLASCQNLCICIITIMQVDGDGVKGRLRKRWREVLKEDMRKKGLCREDAWDRSRWRRMLWEAHRRRCSGRPSLVKSADRQANMVNAIRNKRTASS